MWRHVVCNTLTGKRLAELRPVESTWDRLANEVGGGRLKLHLPGELARASHRRIVTDTGTFRTYMRNLLRPWERTVVICWDETPVYAGPITKRAWDPAKGYLEVTSVEIRAVLARRTAFSVGGYTGGDWGIYDLDLRSAAYVAIRKGLAGGDGRWNLRMLETWVDSGSVRRYYPRWEHKTIEEVLRELQDIEGGPDIDFRPHWSSTDGGLIWEPRLGVPLLQAPVYPWHASADRGSLVSWSDDATQLTTGVHVVGSGQEADMIRAGVAVSDAAYQGLWLDSVIDVKDIEDPAVLAAHGRSYGATYSRPAETFSVKVRADGTPRRRGILGPTAAGIMPGIRARIAYDGDLWLPDGPRTGYALGVHGSIRDPFLTLDVKEVHGAA